MNDGRVQGDARAPGIVRGPLTWHLYLFVGFFQYLIGIQGNVLPFLQRELDLSYRTVGLHPSAVAVGAILVGIFGDTLVRRFGRRSMLIVGASGFVVAAVFLCLAPAAPVSIASCFLMGAFGGFIPTVVFATLAEIHADNRSVAFNEATAVAYLFGIMAPLMTGFFVWISLGWRSAVLAGVAVGVAAIASFIRQAPLPEAASRGLLAGRLPAAYWAYWTALAFSVATEFSVLLWAPAFLERVVGLSTAAAATAAVAFAIAMFTGRVAGSGLARFIAAPRLFTATLVVSFAGFVLYWGVAGQPIVAVVGLFVLGLGLAQTYPLSFGQAMGTAGSLGDRASVRTAIAAGVALLSMPAALGFFADGFGLHRAHLIVPCLMVAALAAFQVGRALERNAKA